MPKQRMFSSCWKKAFEYLIWSKIQGFAILFSMNFLYLTPEEQQKFSKIDPTLTDGWRIETETLDCYESTLQLQMRYNMADFTMHPSMKDWAERILNGESVTKFSVADIDASAYKELFFVLGAKGLKAIIGSILEEVREDDDVRALQELCMARHKMLEINRTAVHR